MGDKYSQTKIFHFPNKLASLPAENDQIEAPIHVRIKPTNICAHNCWYCAYKVDNLQLGKDMVERDSIPKHKMLEIIQDLDSMGTRAVTFSGGGDPFYYKYLTDAVKALADTNVKFASLTNGAKLKGEVAEVFAHHGTWIRISIDGWDAKSYAKYRDINDLEFGKVMENMESFKKLGGDCYLGISFIIDQTNAPHVYEFVTRLKDIGVDSVKIAPCITSNDNDEANDYHKPIFASVKSQVEEAKSVLQDNSFEIFDSYHQLDTIYKKQYTWCPNIQVLPVIGADLNVYSCHDKAYNLDEGKLGSIKNTSFKEFWFSDKNQFYKIDPSKVCNHHCVADRQNRLILDYLNADKEHLDFT